MKSFQRSHGIVGSWLLAQKIKKLERKYYAKLIFPDEIAEGFDELIGMNAEKEILKDALNFFEGVEIHVNDTIIQPYTRYVLAGAPGAGKSYLVKALAKEANVPLIVFNAGTFQDFPKEVVQIIDLIFSIVESFSNGCILTFENFSAVCDEDSDSIPLLHNHLTTRIQENENAVIIIQTAGSLKMPLHYFGNNLFNGNKALCLSYPLVEAREEYFTKYLSNFDIELDHSLIERLANNTLGLYPKDIEYVIKETVLRMIRTESDSISFDDFQETILQMSSGEKRYTKMTEEERISTAYHEAGHVIVGYYTDSEYSIGRVEITPRESSLGLTVPEKKKEKYCSFSKEYRAAIMLYLGGKVAEMLIYNDTSDGVTADLAYANDCATRMIKQLGMDPDLGPIVFDKDVGFNSKKYRSIAEDKMQALLKDLEKRAFQVVSNHRAQLEALAKALLEKEALSGDEIKRIIIESEEAQAKEETNHTLIESNETEEKKE